MGQTAGWPRSLTKNGVSETVLGNELRGEPQYFGDSSQNGERPYTYLVFTPRHKRPMQVHSVPSWVPISRSHNPARQLALFLSISKMRTVSSKKLSELSEVTLTLCDSVSMTSGQSHTNYGTEASSTPGIGQCHCLQ